MYFYGYPSVSPILWLPLAAFKIWMLVDAMNRSGGRCGGPNYWFIICWVPFGDWIYFFAVKMNDPEFAKLKVRLFTRPTSLDDLRYQERHAPSVTNKLRLARGLYNAGEYADCEPLLNQVLTMDTRDREARYLLSQCKRAQGDLVAASEELQRIVDADISFREYGAASELASIYWQTGRRDEAVEFLRKLFKKSHRMNHTTDLARYLIELDKKEEAKTVLMRAIDDFEHAPRFVRKQDRAAAKEATTILRTL